MGRPTKARILGLGIAAVLIVGCGPPTLVQVEQQRFASVSEFHDSVACRQWFETFPHWSGVPPVIGTEAEAIEMAESLLGVSNPEIDKAVKAGEVWLLVDSEGLAFAAMEALGASIGGCYDY